MRVGCGTYPTENMGSTTLFSVNSLLENFFFNVSIRLLIYEVIVINLSITWYCLYSVSIAVILPGGHAEAVGRKDLTKIIYQS